MRSSSGGKKRVPAPRITGWRAGGTRRSGWPARAPTQASGPPTSIWTADCALRRTASSTTSFRTSRLCQSTRSSVRENTILGSAVQIPANSSIAPGAAEALPRCRASLRSGPLEPGARPGPMGGSETVHHRAVAGRRSAGDRDSRWSASGNDRPGPRSTRPRRRWSGRHVAPLARPTTSELAWCGRRQAEERRALSALTRRSTPPSSFGWTGRCKVPTRDPRRPRGVRRARLRLRLAVSRLVVRTRQRRQWGLTGGFALGGFDRWRRPPRW